MSVSKQSTLNGAETGVEPARQHEENLHDFAQVLWEIGKRDDLDSTEAELQEAARVATDRGLIEGGDGQ